MVTACASGFFVLRASPPSMFKRARRPLYGPDCHHEASCVTPAPRAEKGREKSENKKNNPPPHAGLRVTLARVLHDPTQTWPRPSAGWSMTQRKLGHDPQWGGAPPQANLATTLARVLHDPTQSCLRPSAGWSITPRRVSHGPQWGRASPHAKLPITLARVLHHPS